MAGIEDRVQAFLDSWPIIKERLEELITTATAAVPEEKERIGGRDE